MISTIANLAWSWFKSNIKLPFNAEQLKTQAFEVACNQGLPALVSSLESIVPENLKPNLDHGIWQAVKKASQCNNPSEFVQQAGTVLQNSGQADAILQHIQN
jgi:hypothetical protein